MTTPFKALLILLCMAMFSIASKAQGTANKEDYENVICTYPQSFFSGSLRLGYERVIGMKSSLHFIGSLGTGEESDFYGVDAFTEFHVELQPRFYILKDTRALDGAFVGPYALYRGISYKDTRTTTIGPGQTQIDIEGAASAFEIGYLIGFQRVAASRFTMGVYAGGGMSFAQGAYEDINETGLSSYRKGISPHIGVSLGVAF